MSYDSKTGYYFGYIYCITNMINNKKYIGQTIVDIDTRWKQHINAAHKDSPRQVISKAIKKYGEENFYVEELLRVFGEDKDSMRKELDKLETILIKTNDTGIGNKNGYNVESGGTNGYTYFRPIVAYTLTGKVVCTFDSPRLAAEYYDTDPGVIRKVCSGRMFNYKNQIVFRYKEDPFDKFPPVNPGKHFDVNINPENEFDPNICSHCSVDVYERSSLKYVGTYKNMTECSSAFDVESGVISAVCNGKIKAAKNYIFRHHGDSIDKYDYIPKFDASKKRINKYSLEGEYICTYESVLGGMRDAGGKYSTGIRFCCKGKRNKAYGFKWFYADDPNQPDKSKIIPKE